MNSNYADMQSILDMEKWQSIQDRLAIVTGTAIITVDYKGVPITEHSQCSEFCNRIRSEPRPMPSVKNVMLEVELKR